MAVGAESENRKDRVIEKEGLCIIHQPPPSKKYQQMQENRSHGTDYTVLSVSHYAETSMSKEVLYIFHCLFFLKHLTLPGSSYSTNIC